MPFSRWQRFQADRLYKQAQRVEPLDDQLQLLKRVITLDPNHKEAHRRLLSLGQKGSCWSELELFYQKLAQEHPAVAMVRNYWGVLFYLSGRAEVALVKMEEAKQLDPDYVTARNNLAMINAEYFGRYDEAIAEYERTLKIEPENDVAHGNLGLYYQRVGRFDEAYTHLTRAAELLPSGYHLAALGDFYFYGSELETARRWYEKALNREHASLGLGHDRTHTRLNLARCYLNLQHYQLAVDTILEAFRLPRAQESIGLHRVLGQAYAALGNIVQAILHLEHALAFAADNEMAQGAIYRSLAQVYYKAGDYHKASIAYQLSSSGRYDMVDPERRGDLIIAGRELAKAMLQHPQDALIRLEYGKNLYRQGRWDEAVRVLHDALAQKPDLAEAHYWIAWIFILLDDPVEASHHTSLATYYQPQSDRSFVLAGVSALYEGEYDQAAMSFRRALLLNSRSAEAHNYLGDVYQYEHKYEEARSCFEHALEFAPDLYPARYNLAYTLHQLGQSEAALDHVKRLLAAQPTHLMGWRLLADVQIGMGRLDQAQSTLQRAMAINPYCLPVQEKLAALQRGQPAVRQPMK